MYKVKSLSQYLFEAMNNYIIDNIVVMYDCASDLYIQVPHKYSESDVVAYLDDQLLNKLPGSSELSKKFFGINSKHIIDAYFEYDSISATLGKNQQIDITWNESYDSSIKSTAELQTYQIKNLKYIIEFEYFEFDSTIHKDNVQTTIENLFQSTISNNTNIYPISISLNNSNIQYEVRN